MSDAPHLLTQDQDGILIVTLNRPDKLNALSAQTMALFEQALLRFRDTPELRVMLIRATGRYFCSGADLKSGGNPDYPRTPSGIRAAICRQVGSCAASSPAANSAVCSNSVGRRRGLASPAVPAISGRR